MFTTAAADNQNLHDAAPRLTMRLGRSGAL
jgi:hypothetical protein